MAVTQPVGHFPELGTLLWECRVAFRGGTVPPRAGHGCGHCPGGEMSPGAGGQRTWLLSVTMGMWDGVFVPRSGGSRKDLGNRGAEGSHSGDTGSAVASLKQR